MASYSTVFVCNVVFLLISILLVSTSAEHPSVVSSIIPSVESTGTPTENYFCDTNANVYTTQVWGPTKDCFLCTPYCYGACDSLRTTSALSPSCTWISGTNVRCECCCVKPKSPPPPACPPPAPLPPPPPCPSPSSDKCDTGDDVTETTMPSSNCADCTNWCNEDCSESGGRVIENKCAIGESKFVRRCSCCCRGRKSLLKSVLKLS
ncbi:hypothetical protein MKW98_003921 [Papaver atlanticum]|uniref:Uncharacterized protein n=1 Tax=Papaver atlanticum TaxID=357466 RepID=A0AAD4SPA2_9MAGN|nr:hypothetical protein MKW98_003921 [Papaver atlanticum]